ncbi:hypothetical protein H257_01972 [Aphanomyces astaci]|uniref:Vacuolar membrane protease n=1 Tax=Aphanomyces astaci TaxID=112090 RepID=W4H6M2_APHAT|nr:hypothetical protein H257_01972 [Aphanomyces astaci]ETV86949.1 hypothetical protein H257_01972 [Aphanomyces astaci]|eukprot:XP_009823748.1 hypothetical protein H257_01972 [Aphanomyces astaci]
MKATGMLLLPWVVVGLLAVGVQYANSVWRSQLPPALSLAQASLHGDFAGADAYATLETLANATHPDVSAANQRVYNFIHDKLQDLQTLNGSHKLVLQTARHDLHNISVGRQDTVVVSPPPRKERCDAYAAFFNASQIVVKVPGMFASSVLLSAHFDSVAGSFGASDDGAGVAIALDVLRSVVTSKARPRNSLIVFFNNGEEDYLCGSKWFLDQNLTSRLHVQAFVNLEGGGTGGRAILFRATDEALAATYSQVTPMPHMNSIGGSILAALGSFTDYESYQSAGIPGVDIAFYEHRENYHTMQDNLAHISPRDVQHGGSNVLAFTTALLDVPYLGTFQSDDSAVYFDFVGLWGVTLTANTRFLILLATWLAAGGVVLVYAACFEPTKSIGDVTWRLTTSWSTVVNSLSLSWLGGFMAVLPVAMFVAITRSPKMAWVVLPVAVLGHLVGVTFAAEQWRFRRHLRDDQVPSTRDLAHLAAAAATFADVMSSVVVIKLPGLYLLAIASVTFSVLAIVGLPLVSASIASRELSLADESEPLLRSLDAAPLYYATVPLTQNEAHKSTSTRSWLFHVGVGVALILYMAVPFHFAIDLAVSMNSVGSTNAGLVVALPTLLTPPLYLLVVWFAQFSIRPVVFVTAFALYGGLLVLAVVRSAFY